jgi:prevent-host-death family protein
MDSVGVRELKTHLSRHLKRVRAGARLLVTERGLGIATIAPVDAPSRADWAHAFVAEGGATWNGAKPNAGQSPIRLAHGKAAAVVIEDRR